MKLYQIMFVPVKLSGSQNTCDGFLTAVQIELLRKAISELGTIDEDSVRAQIAFCNALINSGYTKSDSDS